MMFCHWIIFESVIICIWSIDPNQLEVTDTTGTETYVLLIYFDFCALFVFALCLVPSVPCVSGLSILDYSFCFFLTFIVYLFPMQLLTRVIFLRMILFTKKKLCNSYIIPGTNYNNLMKSCDTIDYVIITREIL